MQQALIYTIDKFSARSLLYLKRKRQKLSRREKKRFNDKYYSKYGKISLNYDMICMPLDDRLELADEWNLGTVARDFVSVVEILPSLIRHEDKGAVCAYCSVSTGTNGLDSRNANIIRHCEEECEVRSDLIPKTMGMICSCEICYSTTLEVLECYQRHG